MSEENGNSHRDGHRDSQRDSLQESQREKHSSSKDITLALRGWDYESGTLNVRKVAGLDGRPKLQMRLDLGLLQMELTGRPDGLKPHGCESLLDYHENRLHEHRARHGTDSEFHLSAEQCQGLREEAVMYYQRYLSLFVIEEFGAVVRDTDRNLRLIDFCGKYAAHEEDKLVLEQYRPYITMMNARAGASIQVSEGKLPDALETITVGLARIKKFFRRFGQEDAYRQCNEARILRRLAKRIKRQLPVDPVARLHRQLQKAIKLEAYEEAAKLRDQIQGMEQGA